MAKSGDALNAIQLLHGMLQDFDTKKRDDTNVGRVAGVGIGAAVGSFILPVVGTIIGSALGGLIGGKVGEAELDSESSLKAETHYRLGVIYEMLGSPAAVNHYMMARSLAPDHGQAEAALRRIQPTVPISPQLAALDDDID